LPHLHPAPQHQLQQVQDTGTTFHACPTPLSPRLPHACRTPSCTACAHMRSRSWLTWAEEAQPQCVCASHHRAPPLVARRGGLRGAGLGRLGRLVCCYLPLFAPKVHLTHSVLPPTLTDSVVPPTSLQPPSNLPRTPAPGWACWLGILVPPPHAPGCGLCRNYERVASSDRGLPLSPSLSLSLPLACRLLLQKGLQHARLRLLGCAPAIAFSIALLASCPLLCLPFLCAPPAIPFLTPWRVRPTKSTGVFAYFPISGVGEYASGLAYLRIVVQIAYTRMWSNMRTHGHMALSILTGT
jgi:hypothetical protein